jgi:hypothetical protein
VENLKNEIFGMTGEAGKPKPFAESRRMLSEITLSRQSENTQINVVGGRAGHKIGKRQKNLGNSNGVSE